MVALYIIRIIKYSTTYPASDLSDQTVEGIVHTLSCLGRGLDVGHVVILCIGRRKFLIHVATRQINLVSHH